MDTDIDFETRARAAGRELHAATAAIELRGIASRRVARRHVVLIGVAALVAIVGALVLARTNGRHEASIASVPGLSDTPRYLVPTWLPEGLVLGQRSQTPCGIAPGATVPPDREGNDPPGALVLCFDDVWAREYVSTDGRYVAISQERRPEPPTALPSTPLTLRGLSAKEIALNEHLIRFWWHEAGATYVVNAARIDTGDVLRLIAGLNVVDGPTFDQRETRDSELFGAGFRGPTPFDKPTEDLPEVAAITADSGERFSIRESIDRRRFYVFSPSTGGGGASDSVGFETRPPWPRYGGGGGGTLPSGTQWAHYHFDLPADFPTDFSVRTINGREVQSVVIDHRILVVNDTQSQDRSLLQAISPQGEVITALYAPGRARA